MLILDLDDTIYPAASLSPQVLEPALSAIRDHYSRSQADEIVAALWFKPIDVVVQQFNIPSQVIEACFEKLEQVPFDKIEIQPFEDYQVLRQFSEKVLVTSGIHQLQHAKIDALGIKTHFKDIFVDDPRLQPRRHKLDIFKSILQQTQLSAEDIWVIGDNPTSELQAGKVLGMRTVQRKSPHHPPWEQADYFINSFRELENFVN